MKNFFASLGTIFQEPRILAEAWGGQVNLPPNYWRTQLAMFTLVCSSRKELPRALQFNYCPLFWFTNILVLLLPAIISIAVVIKLVTTIANFVGTFGIEPAGTFIDTWCTNRKEVRATVKEAKKLHTLRSVVYDDRYPNYEKLLEGQDRFERHVRHYLDEGFSFDDPRIPELFAVNQDVMYYVAFRKIFTTNHETKLRELREAWLKAKEQKTKQEIAELERVKAVEKDWNKIFSNIFYWSKIICKALLFVVSVPLTALLCWGLYQLLIIIINCVGWLLHVIFIQNLITTVYVVGGIVLVASIIFGIVIFVQSGALRDRIWDPFVEFLENRIFPVFCFCGRPFAFIGRKVAGGFTFLFNFFRMFYSENCPGVVYTDEMNKM
jgi:hypothetical protein